MITYYAKKGTVEMIFFPRTFNNNQALSH